MAKGLTIASLVIAVLILLLFGLDLALAIPFDRQNPMFDVIFLICGLILAALGFATFRELD